MWKFRVIFGCLWFFCFFFCIVVLMFVILEVNVLMVLMEFDWNFGGFLEDFEFLYFFKMINLIGVYKRVVVRIKSKVRMNKNII